MKRKNLLKIGGILFGIGIFMLNLTVGFQLESHESNKSLSLLSLTEMAYAAEECSLTIGDDVGPNCYVVDDTDYAEWNWTYNTETCEETCEQGGTNCCFNLSKK